VPGKGLADVRVLLAGMSNMLSSIVTAAIAQAPDIVVAGRVGENEDLAAKLGLTPVDAVVVQTYRPEAAESFISLMGRFPALKVIAIDGEGNNGFLYQLRPYSIRLPELSADLLQSVLRTQISVVSQTDWSAVLQLMQAENRSPPC
jgi:hypothetical protein